MGNGGKALSRFEDNISGDGGDCGLTAFLPSGNLVMSLGVLGVALPEFVDALIGVRESCLANGRSMKLLACESCMLLLA